MKFSMSPNVAVRTPQISAATEFYTRVLGLQNRSSDPEFADLDAQPLNMFVIPDEEVKGIVLELIVEDLEEAKRYLVRQGCEVIRWRGKGQDCYIRDPFGVTYNIWEKDG